jgi:hypothetical protein
MLGTSPRTLLPDHVFIIIIIIIIIIIQMHVDKIRFCYSTEKLELSCKFVCKI